MPSFGQGFSTTLIAKINSTLRRACAPWMLYEGGESHGQKAQNEESQTEAKSEAQKAHPHIGCSYFKLKLKRLINLLSSRLGPWREPLRAFCYMLAR